MPIVKRIRFGNSPDLMDRFGKVFPAIVQARLDELGTNPFSAEQKAGLPADAIRNVLRADNPLGPRLSRVQEVCDALGLELYIGARRPPADASPLPEDDFASIPRLEVQLSAGPGAEGSNTVIERLAFRRDWLYRLGVEPGTAAIVAVRGDSMAPGLQDGDLVLVDGARTTIRARRVYAFTDIDGQLRVKRLEPIPKADQLVIRSDNADAPTEVRHGDDAARLLIHGEVVWSAHTWRER